jgi:N-carbamoylputrescine amidase
VGQSFVLSNRWHPGEKEQYGENQYGWMNIMKGHASKWVYVAAANRMV